jgi:hypothetical protein
MEVEKRREQLCGTVRSGRIPDNRLNEHLCRLRVAGWIV